MRRLAISLMLFAALLSPAVAQNFGAETFVLDNGMQVVVVPNHRVPAVTQMVWYKVGAADDPRGKSGLAHFLEHLMFKGTKAHPAGSFDALISRNGGDANAFTTDDYTVFHETFVKRHLDLAMQLEADRMTGLVLHDRAVRPERNVVLEERHLQVDNDPSSLLSEQLASALFLNASSRIPTIGWESEIRRLTTADAKAFYHTWYAPNNAILIVAGDIDRTQVQILAKRRFGPLATRPVPIRLRPDEPPHHAAIRLEMKSAQSAHARWSRLYLAPSYCAGATGHAYALQVLAKLLGGGGGSRLYESLVLERGLALEISTDYEPDAIGITDFAIHATPRPGVALPDLEGAIDAELFRLLEHGVNPDEVDDAKRRLQADVVYTRDSFDGPSNLLGMALAIGRNLDNVAQWPERIGAVTLQEVITAARAVLVEHNSATGILLPERTS